MNADRRSKRLNVGHLVRGPEGVRSSAACVLQQTGAKAQGLGLRSPSPILAVGGASSPEQQGWVSWPGAQRQAGARLHHPQGRCRCVNLAPHCDTRLSQVLDTRCSREENRPPGTSGPDRETA